MELPEVLEVFPRAMHNQMYNWNMWLPCLLACLNDCLLVKSTLSCAY